MKILKLDEEVTLMVRERSLLVSRARPGEEIEMEARLGVKPGSSGTDILYWLNAYAFARKIAEKKTWANYVHTIVEDSNVKFRKRNNEWSVKKEIRSVFISNNWAKIAVAAEAWSHPPSHMEEKEKTSRYIARHSFYVGSNRIDFTKSYTNGNLTYEVEVEYLAPVSAANTPERYSAWQALVETGYKESYKKYLATKAVEIEYIVPYVNLIRSLTSAMFLTPLDFTYEMLATVSVICNTLLQGTYTNKANQVERYLDKRFLSEARALDIQVLNYSTFFRNGRTWTVCLKTDYQRRILVICDKGTWLLFPPMQASLHALTEAHSVSRLTIADVEYRSDTGDIWLLDTLWIDGWDERNTESHLVRYDKFREWQQKRADPTLFGILRVNYKRHNIITGSDFFSMSKEMWESRHGAGFEVDGLIYTPDTRYQESTDEDTGITFKWKPDITIDLEVNKDSRGNMIVLSTAPDKSREQFLGDDANKLLGIDMASIPYIRGSIIEFSVDKGRLVAMRERAEKPAPNRTLVAVDSWRKATADTLRIDLATLLGQNNVLMRKHHNRVKSSLIDRASKSGENLTLLDIGSGRGGDLSKWKKAGFSKIICIEPDDKNIASLKMRLRSMPADFQSRVHIFQARGEDSARIRQFVNQQGIDRVHIVSMMDSLTYFFDPERKNLDALGRTVDNLLVDGGLFIWKCLDGSSVQHAMSVMGSDTLVYEDSKISLVYGTNTVAVDIPPNQIGIEEYLTDIRALKNTLDLSGEPEISREEAMLTAPYIALSRLFSSGMFIKGRKLAPSREMVQILQYTTVRKITVSTTPYLSLIEAIEKTFSSKSHSVLLSEYQYTAKQRDEEYAAVGSEPSYFKFETVYLGFFTSMYLDKSRDDQFLLEDDIYSQLDIKDVHTSLAFASLLRLDVFIVDEQGNQLQTTQGTPLTNAVVGHTDNPCVIVISANGGYVLKPFKDGMPIALSSDAAVANMLRQEEPDFHKWISETLQDIVRVEERGSLFLVNKIPATNVLDRVAHVEGVSSGLRYLSLANTLLNRSARTCTATDLEDIGVESSQAAINYVNRMMVELNEAR
ncbi:mRNA capping enzyme [uncultured virus]|nr:mRNA capping enzyme [uncultured virus]